MAAATERLPAPQETRQAGARAESTAGSAAGRILLGVTKALDRAGVRYCILHGYEDLPHRISSDVDGLIDNGITSSELLQILQSDRNLIGADVVACREHHLVLAGRNENGSRFFLTLDFSSECEVEGFCFYDGPKLLAARRRHGSFWVPPPALGFGAYLTRSIARGCLDAKRTLRLMNFHAEDPAGSEAEITRFFDAADTALIADAARYGNWTPIQQDLRGLRSRLRRRALVKGPARYALNRTKGFLERGRRLMQPEGLFLAFLGPDGAGKSSVIEALETGLKDLFARSECHGFTPGIIHRLRHGAYRLNDAPHALAPRSWSMSVARALLYWFPYYTVGYLWKRVALARSTLVLNDRHFVDVLVDQRRYRYGGPQWLVRLLWRLIPKPDMLVLLDAPAEVIQSRKQEVPLAETARQREAYLQLTRGIRNAHVVDAARPIDAVAQEVIDLAVQHLATRLAGRLSAAGQYRAPSPGDGMGFAFRHHEHASRPSGPRIKEATENE